VLNLVEHSTLFLVQRSLHSWYINLDGTILDAVACLIGLEEFCLETDIRGGFRPTIKSIY
jgi:hypothetical protein